MPSSSQILSASSLVLSSLFAASPVSAATSYSLSDSIQGETFFNNFYFDTGVDKTKGFVDFLDYADATAAGLLNVTSSSVKFGVDYTNVYSTSDTGRKSVKLVSNKKYGHGLIVADIAHMPASICGLWPAFWTNGDGDWPAGGELDIIEGINDDTTNRMAAHTSDGCSIDSNNTYSGSTLVATDCAVSDSTVGCYYQGDATDTYGTGFNDASGGVYALEATSESIKLWFWARSAIPESITAGEPDIDELGTPIAVFKGACDIDSHFTEQSLIFDTTFCGDWAGNSYSSSCPMYDSSDPWASCVSYVASPSEGPSVFEEAYWEINSIKFYEQADNTTSNSNSSVTATPSGTGNAGLSASAKETITATLTSSYVDNGPSGVVTSVVTQYTTYCPADQASGTAAVAGESSVASAGTAAAPVTSSSADAAAIVPVPTSYALSSESPATEVSTGTSADAASSVPTASVESGAAGAAATPSAGSVSTIKPWYPIASNGASNSTVSGVAGGAAGSSAAASAGALQSGLTAVPSSSTGAGATGTSASGAQFTGGATTKAVSGVAGLLAIAVAAFTL